MPDPITRCSDHGYVDGTACPDCASAGERVLAGERRRRLSKFCSGALRHFPDDAGLELDEAGWTPVDALAAAVEDKYDWAGRTELEAIVATDPKGRFERRERHGDARIRAAYGHSVDVDLDGSASSDRDGDPIPDTLYHGTAPRNLDSIRAAGLRPMNRQRVHLSGTLAAARDVGARHADDPVVLDVDAAAMLADDHRIVRRGRAVYTTEAVPSTYLAVREE